MIFFFVFLCYVLSTQEIRNIQFAKGNKLTIKVQDFHMVWLVWHIYSYQSILFDNECNKRGDNATYHPLLR